jgi:hypothetical protein
VARQFVAMARVANGWRLDSWGLWCRAAVEVVELIGRIRYVAVMVANDTGCS